MKRVAAAIVVAACLAWTDVSLSDTRVSLVQEAVQEYQEGMNTKPKEMRLEHFRRSQRLFAQVIEEQGIKNAQLYVNLGNAALQATDLGNAVLAYRRALVLEPGNQRARQNLGYARDLLPDWVPRPKSKTLLDTFFFWHRTLSVGARQFGASLAFVMAAVLLAVGIRWRWTWARNLALLPAAVWLGLSGVSLWRSDASNEAVITAVEVVVHAADSLGAPPRFSEALPGGAEVRIVEQRDDWVQIRLADSRDGWVRGSGLTLVSPG